MSTHTDSSYVVMESNTLQETLRGEYKIRRPNR
jgi:hypothetical protein